MVCFEQSPEVHILQKAGCPKCADEKNGENLKTQEQFIEEAHFYPWRQNTIIAKAVYQGADKRLLLYVRSMVSSHKRLLFI